MISAEDANDAVQREAHHNMEERLAETPLGVGILYFTTLQRKMSIHGVLFNVVGFVFQSI